MGAPCCADLEAFVMFASLWPERSRSTNDFSGVNHPRTWQLNLPRRRLRSRRV